MIRYTGSLITKGVYSMKKSLLLSGLVGALALSSAAFAANPYQLAEMNFTNNTANTVYLWGALEQGTLEKPIPSNLPGLAVAPGVTFQDTLLSDCSSGTGCHAGLYLFPYAGVVPHPSGLASFEIVINSEVPVAEGAVTSCIGLHCSVSNQLNQNGLVVNMGVK